jgi:hypothetical protein
MLKVVVDTNPKILGYSTLSGLFIEGLQRTIPGHRRGDAGKLWLPR